jgi:trans-aconitate 2-methyltransferase
MTQTTTQTTNHYTFGENDLAAQRLAYLAAAYERPAREFLATWGTADAEHAVDLGCGPGYTSLLLQFVLSPRQVTGLDASDKLLTQAKLRAPHIAFLRHDITRAPFPCAKADVLYCRFLLTHLQDPGLAIRAWADAAKPGARLLIQETASLESDEPVIRRYYQLVAALQAGYGQSLHVGADLDRHVGQHGWTILSSELPVVEQEARTMARLHAMNIRTWSQDVVAQRSFDPAEIAQVQAGLDRIAAGEQGARPVRNVLRQLVAVRS